MGVEDEPSDLGFDHRGGDSVNLRASRKSTLPLPELAEESSPISMAAARDAHLPPPPANLEQFFVSDWNPFISASQSGDFIRSAAPCYGALARDDERMGGLIDQIPGQLPFGGGENISEVMNTFSLPPDFPSLSSPGLPCSGENGVAGQKRRAPGGSEPPASWTSEDAQKREKSLKKPRGDGEDGANSHKGDDPTREDYIHVRAKRGQATNSHSLAERLRREKISERMRFLQHLVPGCSKITGKAVMLDEIINYVQSLQRQVEFLSMKLAAVNPELNLDIQRILSQDILLLQAGASGTRGSDPPGGAASYPQFHLPLPHGAILPEIDGNPETAAMLKRPLAWFSPAAQVPDLWGDAVTGVLPGSRLGTGSELPGEAQEGSLLR